MHKHTQQTHARARTLTHTHTQTHTRHTSVEHACRYGFVLASNAFTTVRLCRASVEACANELFGGRRCRRRRAVIRSCARRLLRAVSAPDAAATGAAELPEYFELDTAGFPAPLVLMASLLAMPEAQFAKLLASDAAATRFVQRSAQTAVRVVHGVDARRLLRACIVDRSSEYGSATSAAEDLDELLRTATPAQRDAWLDDTGGAGERWSSGLDSRSSGISGASPVLAALAVRVGEKDLLELLYGFVE
jgi:hypothetical protein